jgi:predicted HNH restriction endonuclease
VAAQAGPDGDGDAPEDATGGEDGPDSLNPEPSAIEGEIVHALKRHRRREQWLREEKIRSVMQATGRLRCEVPRCGFDFVEVYGEIGEGFAHVHHLRPLGDLSEPSATTLSDLAIVCPNCHAMIHRGGTVRPIEGLIKGKCRPLDGHARQVGAKETEIGVIRRND